MARRPDANSEARPSLRTRVLVALGLAAIGLATGCSRNIGDPCTLSTDCSVTGDRLCDTTEPGGYCTVFNCEPNSCPKDSVCVLFADNTCSAATQSIRFRRTFCMATCEGDGDCRAGYRCLDMTQEAGRSVVDLDPISLTVCMVPQTAAPPPASSADEPAICRAAPAPLDSGVTSDAALAAPDQATEGLVDATLDASGEGAVDAALFDGAAEVSLPDVAAEVSLPEGSADGPPLDVSVPDASDEGDGGPAPDASLLE